MAEADIARMRVDEIRAELRRLGVTGTSGLRKPDLMSTLARAMRGQRRPGGAARQAGGPAGAKRTGPTGAKRTGPAAGRAASTSNRTGTAAKRTGAAAKRAAPAARTGGPTKPGTGTAGRSRTASATGGARQGATRSRSVRYAQQISSLSDQPERPGRSLVTKNHDVIRRWARARQAKPATITGTERDGRPGVLTFNMPGYRESSRLKQITWEEWFRTFDARRLNLIYQEQLRDGRQSNFFRTESPDREDG
ncbi:hypothetical protein GSF22_18960 [Micromonospora echinofusca]|uniref:Rho termination factor, N-terminal domain n=1 Tax=Micromonospora echinofusca TaxID=47858 RepID=A0ABS3VUL5_MICEH|nr:hypothetical protein [Micromonospora echinofusca]